MICTFKARVELHGMQPRSLKHLEPYQRMDTLKLILIYVRMHDVYKCYSLCVESPSLTEDSGKSE